MNMPVYRTNTFYHPAYPSQSQPSPASSSGQHSPRYFAYNSPPTISTFPHMSASSSLNTPSSASSLSILTPLSPPLPEFADYYKDTLLDEDDIEMDDSESDDEDIDSDFADDMDGVDDGGAAGGVDQSRLLRSTSSWHQESMHSFASISALDGALGHYSRPITTTTAAKSHLRSQDIDDRKMSMSAPGHPRVSYPSLDVQVPHAHQQQQQHQRQRQRPEPNNAYYTVSRSHHPSPYLYPQPDTYTNISPSSTALFAPLPSPVHNVHHPMAPPSTTANFSTNAVSSAASANPYHSRRPAAAPQAPVPILQPQPIRPIPPIPLSDLAAASEEERDRDHTSPRAGVPDHHHHQNSHNNSHNNRLMKSEKSPGLSPLSLLCQPVSDAVRYQLKTMGDLAGNTSSEEDDEEDDDEDEEVNDAEATLGAYVGIVSDDMILPSSQTTAYFDTRLTRPNKVKQFQCDCGCMGVCLG